MFTTLTLREYVASIFINIRKMFNIFNILHKSYIKTKDYQASIQEQVKIYADYIDTILLLILICWFCIIIFDYIVLNKTILHFIISFLYLDILHNITLLYIIIGSSIYVIIISMFFFIINLYKNIYKKLDDKIIYKILSGYGQILILF